MSAESSRNDAEPNFRRRDGRLYLVRCFECGGDRGTENYLPAVASGVCAWCGWSEARRSAETPGSEREALIQAAHKLRTEGRYAQAALVTQVLRRLSTESDGT